ncbi:hypothetical protein AVDCRST_MAG82-2658 [uncultured Rubrobacteraceae bacterium]|uniref:Uncharacterized protein n=1 Tax=uncultured Rubrobacteraceae bacterium TaxID=349277 RepID=A0A6J4Q9A0_9ACTN|nr:hypothetical protein AVDCRST_MAG82-2658 [uncultured Rubrobacteraceae bacterium]
MNTRLLARSFAIAAVFSIVLLMTGSVGITVYALALETDITLGPVYAVSFDGSGGFSVTAGPGLFLSFVVVLALLTLLISVGQTRPAARDR